MPGPAAECSSAPACPYPRTRGRACPRRLPARAPKRSAARLGEASEAGRDVDAITKDVAVLDDDISDIDPDTEVDAAIQRQRGVALGQRRLRLGCASEHVGDAGELDQRAIAGGLDDAAAMAGDLRIDRLGAERLVWGLPGLSVPVSRLFPAYGNYPGFPSPRFPVALPSECGQGHLSG